VSLPSSKKIAILRDRAAMLAAARLFFANRNVMEVDCPLLTAGASVDAHIDLISASNAGEIRYLHSSPEYGMKRLLADGIGDIYQLAHVFRAAEQGKKHNPEFMMAEWYRCGFTFEEMIHDTLDFIRVFLGDLPASIVSYRDLCKRHTGIDYFTADEKTLLQLIKERDIMPYDGIEEEGKDALLNVILGTLVEPHLGRGELTVLAYYPSTQAALAQTRLHGDEPVAERFEIYYEGIELANGYHELAHATEQRQRLGEANDQRISLGKAPLPIDEAFLKALEKGLPDCCGVAVGVDRLMMLRHNANHIEDVIPFGWSTA